MKFFRTAFFPALLLMASNVSAQAPEMADPMRSNGKIYVVVAVAAIAVLTMGLFMINLERRISKMEKKQGN